MSARMGLAAPTPGIAWGWVLLAALIALPFMPLDRWTRAATAPDAAVAVDLCALMQAAGAGALGGPDFAVRDHWHDAAGAGDCLYSNGAADRRERSELRAYYRPRSAPGGFERQRELLRKTLGAFAFEDDVPGLVGFAWVHPRSGRLEAHYALRHGGRLIVRASGPSPASAAEIARLRNWSRRLAESLNDPVQVALHRSPD